MHYIISVFILSLFTILGVLVFKHQNTKVEGNGNFATMFDKCDNDADCPNDGKCTTNNSRTRCSNAVENSVCNLDENPTICNMEDDNSTQCAYCSNIQWQCSRNKDIVINNKKISLPVPGNPDLGVCQPVISNQLCNNFTSQYQLTKSRDGNDYSWKCRCKNPTMMTHEPSVNEGSNCIEALACGKNGQLYVPLDEKKICAINSDCNGTDKCCLEDDSIGRVCHVDGEPGIQGGVCHRKWDRLDKSVNESDPSNGKCLCDDGYTYTGSKTDSTVYTKKCIPDTWSNGNGYVNARKSTDGITLTCDPGYISCDKDNIGVSIKNQFLKAKCENNPSCIEDPCKNGYIDENGDCQCNDNYVVDSDPTSANLQYCRPLPTDGSNCNFQGTSYKDEFGEEKCRCNCPWTGDTCKTLGLASCPGERCNLLTLRESTGRPFTDNNCYNRDYDPVKSTVANVCGKDPQFDFNMILRQFGPMRNTVQGLLNSFNVKVQPYKCMTARKNDKTNRWEIPSMRWAQVPPQYLPQK